MTKLLQKYMLALLGIADLIKEMINALANQLVLRIAPLSFVNTALFIVCSAFAKLPSRSQRPARECSTQIQCRDPSPTSKEKTAALPIPEPWVVIQLQYLATKKFSRGYSYTQSGTDDSDLIDRYSSLAICRRRFFTSN